MKEQILNYPTFYAPMPIVENEQIVAYIASKCYLLEENKTYYPDGTSKTIYTILYFYNQDKIVNKPIFYGDICVNATKINVIFNELNQCRAYVRRKNNESLYQSVGYLSIDEIRKRYYNLSDTFQVYYDLEYDLLQLSNKLISFEKIRKMYQI